MHILGVCVCAIAHPEIPRTRAAKRPARCEYVIVCLWVLAVGFDLFVLFASDDDRAIAARRSVTDDRSIQLLVCLFASHHNLVGRRVVGRITSALRNAYPEIGFTCKRHTAECVPLRENRACCRKTAHIFSRVLAHIPLTMNPVSCCRSVSRPVWPGRC